MKKAVLALTAALLVGGAALAFAHGPQGGGPWGYGRMGCRPMMGGRMMGPRMERGWMGRGWMGQGWMHGSPCPWDMLNYTPSGQLTQPLEKSQVQAMAEYFIAGNPNLKIGKITEKDGTYIVEIVTKKGSAPVDKIAIDKTTGMMQPVN